MNYSKFKLLVRMGGKLLFPLQVRKLANYAMYRTRIPVLRKRGPNRAVFSPLNIVVSVTARCNKRCSFCYFNGELNTDDASQLELTYEKFLDIINHRLVVNALRIAFTGGEPLLNKDVFKMTAEAKGRGYIVSVITNGKLLKQCFSEITASPPHVLTVTYYPEDRQQLAESLPLFAGKVPLKLDFILSKNRLAELENVLKLAVAANVCLVDIENMTITSNSDEQPIREDDVEFQRLKSKLDKEYGKQVPINWRKPLPGHGKDKPAKCLVFWYSLHVDAKGKISPCCQWPLRTYQDNIFANNQAWNSELMMSLRKQMRNGKIPDYCKGCSALYEDYLGI